MSAQQHEGGDLQDLIGALTELVGYCEAFEAHAQGAAHAVTGQWKGMASAEFVQQVSIWSAGANALRASASDLQVWASAAAASYEAAQSNAQAFWTSS